MRALTRPFPSLPPLPLRRHQIAAWKAGHKHKCGAPGQGAAAAQLRRAAQGGAQLEAARAPAGLTAQQRRLKTRLFELQDADDWLGVVALEQEALALARELRGADPGLAGKVHGILGLGFESTGDYGRARDMYEQHRAISEALGDRAGVQAGGTGAGAGERADASMAPAAPPGKPRCCLQRRWTARVRLDADARQV